MNTLAYQFAALDILGICQLSLHVPNKLKLIIYMDFLEDRYRVRPQVIQNISTLIDDSILVRAVRTLSTDTMQNATGYSAPDP